jgi:hypothetical protein
MYRSFNQRLSEEEFRRHGYHCPDEHWDTVQAYADHILLFSSSYEGMITSVDTVKDFIRESYLQLHLKKCRILQIGRYTSESFPFTDDLTREIINLV